MVDGLPEIVDERYIHSDLDKRTLNSGGKTIEELKAAFDKYSRFEDHTPIKKDGKLGGDWVAERHVRFNFADDIHVDYMFRKNGRDYADRTRPLDEEFVSLSYFVGSENSVFGLQRVINDMGFVK